MWRDGETWDGSDLFDVAGTGSLISERAHEMSRSAGITGSYLPPVDTYEHIWPGLEGKEWSWLEP
ncbi:MAG: hypothetical protein AMXMBFR61_07150 [Fimbriimonadales bacterium]